MPPLPDQIQQRPGHPLSMLTGLIPQRHGVRLLFQKISGRILTVPDYLAHAGYQTSAVVSNFVLTAEASGLDIRFGHYNDLVDEQESYRLAFERRASRTTDAAVEWLVKGRDPGQPHFLWVHYIDPHGPYQPSVDGLTNFTHSEIRLIDKDKIPDYQQEPGLLDGNEYVDRYDEEIAYVDREVGRLLDVYERLGLAKDATVVLTADHGESMMEHEQWFSHGYHRPGDSNAARTRRPRRTAEPRKACGEHDQRNWSSASRRSTTSLFLE